MNTKLENMKSIYGENGEPKILIETNEKPENYYVIEELIKEKCQNHNVEIGGIILTNGEKVLELYTFLGNENNLRFKINIKSIEEEIEKFGNKDTYFIEYHSHPNEFEPQISKADEVGSAIIYELIIKINPSIKFLSIVAGEKIKWYKFE